MMSTERLVWLYSISIIVGYLMANPVYTGCFNIHGTHVTDYNSTNYNVVFFLASDFKIVYYNNY